MSYYGAAKDKTGVIKSVLLHLQPISEAPKNIISCPGYDDLFKDPTLEGLEWPEYKHQRGLLIDDFLAQKLAEESYKDYKAVDKEGNVYIVKNPWAIKPTEPTASNCGRLIISAPRLKYTYEQALRESKNVTTSEFNDDGGY